MLNRLGSLLSVSLLAATFVIGCTTPNNSAPAAAALPAAAATVSYTPGTPTTASIGNSATNVSVKFTLPAGLLSTNATINFSTVAQTSVPARAVSASATFITAFKIDAGSSAITTFNVPLTMGGAVPSTIAQGATLNIAVLNSGQWVDVGTFVVGAGGVFTQNLPTTQLPGITGVGTYLIYQPASGSSTAVSNLGLALLADDSNGYGTSAQTLQVVHLFDASGVPLTTPTISYLPFSGAYDMDGQAMTPDGSQGIIVDGGNTVRFFNSVQTGTPIASKNTLDITNYGGDGDAVAILKNGDEAVVSGDGYSALVLVSGITSGNPVVASTIPIAGSRDGLVMSGDEKVLLARGYSNLTVFSVASVTPTAGTIAGTVSHSFTNVKEWTSSQIGYAPLEDGRDGMAISPYDSSKAVVISTNQIRLLSNLTTAPAVGSPVTISGGSAYSVAISQDGKEAIVGTTSGIVLFTGVDTGTLTQVGSVFSPTYGAGSTLRTITTLAITLDNKYVVVCDGYNSALLVIPFTATGFSAPVGILTGVAVPDNDQLLLH